MPPSIVSPARWMYLVPWSTRINFPSALLLHSCTTIIIKEMLNWLEIAWRYMIRWRAQYKKWRHEDTASFTRTSAVLDAYTSVFSEDVEAEQSELYHTNTGFALLAVSLASAVVMNILLDRLILNMVVAGTFVFIFIASLFVGNDKYTKPFMSLRRAGRFIWSDTPFVNFFSLIYIATLLRGQYTIRLQDYVVFRSIAVFELVFMKARLAAAPREKQVALMRNLIKSERIIIHMNQKSLDLPANPPMLSRNSVRAFCTYQRMVVMFVKTSVSYHFGCVTGPLGPSSLPLPAIGTVIEQSELGWRLYRLSEDVMILADCLAESQPGDTWGWVIGHMHGMLLRRLGKRRVVYLVRGSVGPNQEKPCWHSNINLVTGVAQSWLEENFTPGETDDYCIIAGL